MVERRRVPPPAPGEDERRALRAALQALGLADDEQTVGRLFGHLSLLCQWNATYNLTAIRDPQEMVRHHLADCLAAVPPLQRWAQGRALRVLDVGSGGGLPGAVFASLLPDWRVDCVDTVGKKAAFVRQLAVELRLPNLHAVHARVESLAGPYDLITCRAFASLADFTAWSRPALAPAGVWVALKGQAPDGEIAALDTAVEVFHVEQLQVPGLDAQRCLVWMRPSSL